jgi:CBS domain-containing protein
MKSRQISQYYATVQCVKAIEDGFSSSVRAAHGIRKAILNAALPAVDEWLATRVGDMSIGGTPVCSEEFHWTTVQPSLPLREVASSVLGAPNRVVLVGEGEGGCHHHRDVVGIITKNELVEALAGDWKNPKAATIALKLHDCPSLNESEFVRMALGQLTDPNEVTSALVITRGGERCGFLTADMLLQWIGQRLFDTDAESA